MTKTLIWFKRAKLRSVRYKLLISLSGIFGLWMVCGVIIPMVLSAWSNLATRTPLGRSRLVKVEVSADHLGHKERETLKLSPNRVAVHQVQPTLKLLGVGQELIKSGENTRFVIGLLPTEAKRVLKGGTKVSLRVQAPSLELLAQELLYSPRGQALRQELGTTQTRLMASWLKLWPELKSSLKASLPADLFAKLIKDEVFITHLKKAFMVEVSARIDLDELGRTLGESEALASLGSVAFKHVSWKQVFKEVGGGVWQGAKGAGGQISGAIENEWGRGTILPDLSYCALTTASIFAPRSVSGIIGTLFSPTDSTVCNAVVQSAKGVVVKSAKAGAVDLAQQSLNSLMTEQSTALNNTGALVDLIGKQMQAKVLLTHFWTAISQDEALIAHLKKTYGAEGLARISGALREISSSMTFSSKLGELSNEMKTMAKKSLSALLLDHKGQGPNPLLLSVIQEQLSGRSRPIVHVYPGEGDALRPGHLFQHSEGGER